LIKSERINHLPSGPAAWRSVRAEKRQTSREITTLRHNTNSQEGR
jgi:hypothetical protein